MTEKPSVLGLLEAWEARYPLMEENARKETDEQTARYYAARATELRDCASQLRHLLNTLSATEAPA